MNLGEMRERAFNLKKMQAASPKVAGLDSRIIRSADIAKPRATIGGGGGSGATGSPLTAGTSGGAANSLFYLTTTGTGGSNFTFQTNIMKDSPKIDQKANYTQIPILNRSSGIVTYINTSNMTLSVIVELYAIQDKADLNVIQSARNALLSLLYPVTSGVQGPSLCKITIGGDKLINEWACVCTSVGNSFEMDAGFDTEGAPLPRAMYVPLSFLGVEDESKNAKDIYSGGDPYKDPDFHTSGGAGGSAGIGGGGGILSQQQLSNALDALQSIGGNITTPVPTAAAVQSATQAGLQLNGLAVGAGSLTGELFN